MNSHRSRNLYQSKQPWYAPTPAVEAALFVGVQAVMVFCVVLVAAQALAANA